MAENKNWSGIRDKGMGSDRSRGNVSNIPSGQGRGSDLDRDQKGGRGGSVGSKGSSTSSPMSRERGSSSGSKSGSDLDESDIEE
jgi:hypothetical protein